MVMTFTLTLLYHYNSITEPRARFLLSFLEDLSINFPSYFITSILDVHQDTATHDKLIFATAIRRSFATFPSLFLILLTTLPWVPLTRPCMESSGPAASAIPSTSAPFSLTGDVTLEAIMAQLQCTDARLDTFTDELYQLNTRVSHIA